VRSACLGIGLVRMFILLMRRRREDLPSGRGCIADQRNQ